MKERKQFTLGHWEKNVLKENAGIKDETRNLAAWKRKKKKKERSEGMLLAWAHISRTDG